MASPDPYDAFSTLAPAMPSAATAAPPTSAPDPYDAFSTPISFSAGQGSSEHVLTIHGKQSPAPDLGAQAAAQSGFINGIPILGPLISKGEDYVGSRLGAAISGETPERVSANAAAIQGTTNAAHPVASILGSVAGAAASMNPVVQAAPAWFGATGGALRLGQVLAGGATGAAVGGTDAAVRGNDVATGALLGAAGGAAGPVIGATAGRIGEAVADAVAQRGALQGLNVSRPAADILARNAAADGTLGGQGSANIAAAGPDAMLADAGPAVQNVLDMAVQRGGPGAVAARQAIDQRAADAGTSLDAAMDTALGPADGVYSATNDIRTGSAPARAAAYDAAYAQPIDYSSEPGRALEDLVRTRVPAGIIARANNLIRIEGQHSRQIMARVADDGSVTFERMPDVRQLDYITRSLNDVAQRGDGQGALGGNTAEGRSYGNLSRDIRDAMRDAVPEYATALRTAAEPIQARNALEFGSTLLSRGVARDEAADTIGRMTNPELQQVRRGVRASMSEALANIKRTITDPNVDARQAMDVVKSFSSDAAQQKMALLLSAQERTAFAQALTRATRALELRASIAANSRSAARLITHEGVKAAIAPGPIGTLAEGKPYHALQKAVQFVTRRTPADMARREDAVYGELAHALTSHRGPAAVSFMEQLARAHAARAAATSFAQRIPYGPLATSNLLGLLPLVNAQGGHR